MLSRRVAPIWMDSSTTAECAEIAAAVGGNDVLARHTGSRAFERFTGSADPEVLQAGAAGVLGDRSHSSRQLVPGVAARRPTRADRPGDASGHEPDGPGDVRLVARCARRHRARARRPKLPLIAPGWTVVGQLSPLLAGAARPSTGEGHRVVGRQSVQPHRHGPRARGTRRDLARDERHDLRADARAAGRSARHGPRVRRADRRLHGPHVFKNGSLARERIRDAFGLTWADFSRALATTPPGNEGRILLPWFEPEITPTSPTPGVHRFGLAPDDGPGNVRGGRRGAADGAGAALALDGRRRSTRSTPPAAPSANREILQVMADVFGADVYQFEVGNSACLGAALRAFHADAVSEGRAVTWDEVVEGVAEPVQSTPRAARSRATRDVSAAHAALRGLRGARARPRS